MKDALFGVIDPAAENYWQAEVTVQGRKIEVDLNIDDASISMNRVADILKIVADAASLERAARAAIVPLSRLDEEDQLKLYFEHHREELSPQDFAKALGNAEITEEALVASLELQRIGVYPSSEDEAFVVDFSLPGHVTQYLLSVKLDAAGRPTGVDMES